MRRLCVKFERCMNSGVNDMPVPGTKRALLYLMRNWEVIVYSPKAVTQEGRDAIVAWLTKHDLPRFKLTSDPMIGNVLIDDAVVQFNGNWMQVTGMVDNYKNWALPEPKAQEPYTGVSMATYQRKPQTPAPVANEAEKGTISPKGESNAKRPEGAKDPNVGKHEQPVEQRTAPTTKRGRRSK